MLRVIHAITLAAIVAVAAPTPLGAAQSGPLQVSGSGKTSSADGKYVGFAELVVGGEPRPASVVVTFEEPYSDDDSGGQAATTTHTFDFGDGDTITMSARVVRAPTDAPDQESLYATLGVVSGTGAYANARGTLTLKGTIVQATGEASWSVDGRLEN